MDFDHINAATALLASSRGRRVDLGWLVASQREPVRFFAGLHARLDKLGTPKSKSVLGQRYDLYHDLVVRHVGAGRIALRFHDEGATDKRHWLTLSYDELHARCSARAASWAAQGVGPGVGLCVVLHFGLECVVSLLTGARLGVRVSMIEPKGPDYLAPRLAALAPEFIATQAFHAPQLGEHKARLLSPDTAVGRPLASSHVYLPEELCGALFSPLRRTPHQVQPLSCEAAYRGALRDGAVTLALRPGDQLSAPGFHTQQHQPALLFAALMMGATYVHISDAALLRDPSLLDGLSLRSFGVTSGVRDALLERPPPRRARWEHVFKNPEEPTDWEAWREFVEELGLGETPMSNVLIEAASGGSLLTSPRRRGQQWLAELMNVTPAAGRPWALLDFSGSGQRSVADVGVFTALAGVETEADEGEPVGPTYIALGRRRGQEYLYGGTVEPRRCGRVYPCSEVLATLADCPFLHAASVVAVTAGGPTIAHRFVLLGFTGAEPEDEFARLKPFRVAELQRVLETRLSREFLPDHIELFACYARTSEGVVDHEWCQSQYLSGTLRRKLEAPAFQHLTTLRGVIARA